MKTILIAFLSLIAMSFALETAVTASGKKVILKNDGTWEPFDGSKHLDAQDIREAPKVEISLKYKDYLWCSKEKRMLLEADDVAEAAILDSLKQIPKGGQIIVQMPSNNVNTKDPRFFEYRVKDSKGKVLVVKSALESSAVAADEPGLSNLIQLDIPAFSKGSLKIEIQQKGSSQLLEYDLDVQG